MPNRKSQRSRKKMSRRGSPTGSNGSSGLSKVNCQELKAEMAFSMPSREALVDWMELSLNGDLQDPELINPEHIQAQEAMRSPLKNHDRVDSGKRYCLLATIHETTKWGCRALPKSKWNLGSITDMMKDDLNVTEAVILNHITTILYVGWQR